VSVLLLLSLLLLPVVLLSWLKQTKCCSNCTGSRKCRSNNSSSNGEATRSRVETRNRSRSRSVVRTTATTFNNTDKGVFLCNNSASTSSSNSSKKKKRSSSGGKGGGKNGSSKKRKLKRGAIAKLFKVVE